MSDAPREPLWPRAEFVAAAVAVLCYVNALPNDFCDDGNPIVHFNDKINELGQWGTVWTTDYWSETKEATPNRDLLYRPVALSSYRLVRQTAGPAAFPQLAFNVLLHAIMSALVARLCRRVRGSESAALLAGIMFAVLPIHTEVVDNVVGRADMLAALGVLLAVFCHRRSMIATTDRGIVQWRIGAALAAFVAMGSKEGGICVAPIVVLMDGLWYQSWRAASRDRGWWNVRSLFRFAYLLIPLGVYLILRYNALEGHLYQTPALTKTVNVLVDAPVWQRILGVIQLWGMYWEKTVWFKVLSVNYSINAIRLATSVFDPHVIVGTVVAAVLLVCSVAAWHRGFRGVAYLCVAIIVSYFATSNAIVLIQVFFAERIWYLPSVWLAVLAGLAVAPLVRRPIWAIAVAAPLFAMTQRCWIRNAEWRHNVTLYAAAYRDHPDAIGALRLHGQSLVNQGDYENGITLLNKAIDIDLGYTDAHRSLGHAYLKSGHYPSALTHLQIADMQIPHHPTTVEALALTRRLLTARNEPELFALASRAAANPLDTEAELDLIRRLRELGDLEAALDRLRVGEHRFHNSAAWQLEYAVTLVYRNDRDEAIKRYGLCLDLAPDDPQVLIELAALLLERRDREDLDRAWALTDRALKLAPAAPPVLVCRAELLALKGDLAAAGALYQQAIRAAPLGSDQRRRYVARARALGQ